MYNLYGDNMDLWEYENKLYKQGINYIGGVDEVGRGPLVGPVVAACCVLPKDFVLEGLTDSKKLSEKKRNVFFDYLKDNNLKNLTDVWEQESRPVIDYVHALKFFHYCQSQ